MDNEKQQYLNITCPRCARITHVQYGQRTCDNCRLEVLIADETLRNLHLRQINSAAFVARIIGTSLVIVLGLGLMLLTDATALVVTAMIVTMFIGGFATERSVANQVKEYDNSRPK